MEEQSGMERNSNARVKPMERRSKKNLDSKLQKTLTRRSIPVDELLNLSKKDPDEILQHVVKEKAVFVAMFNDESLNHETMAYALIVLGKASTSSLKTEVNCMIRAISCCKMFFSMHVPQYLASFHQLGMSDNDSKSVEMLAELLMEYHLCMPFTASGTTSVLFPLLEKTLETFLSEKENFSDLSTKIAEAKMQNDEFLENTKPKELRFKSAAERLHLQKPPQNYRSIPILPTPDDIHRPCLFLRPNLTIGQYTDAEHYLDVQYRLLREDYIKPLRDGISQYLLLKKLKEPIKNIQDVIIHHQVRIVDVDFTDDNVFHTVSFNRKSFSQIDWEQSKRFKNGSLLCFSDSDFKTFFLAIVIERKEIQKGYLKLEFQEPTDEVLSFDSSRSFVVIETTAYFEAYRHNLAALCLLDEKKLPMKSYILKVQKYVDKPAYLVHDDCYDLSSLLKRSNNHNITKQLDLYEDEDSMFFYEVGYEKEEELRSKLEKINILDDDSWPHYSEINLDPFQSAAIKSALTSEFCLIQGPPGTGKTFVGLKIVEILLANKSKWQSKKICPILIVCYTNHALDQFLEGILDFNKNIVRIGGSYSNPALGKYSLKFQREENHGSPHSDAISKRIRRLKKDIKFQENLVKRSNSEILNERILEYQISLQHFQSLNNFFVKCVKKNTSIMSLWLEQRHNLECEEGNYNQNNLIPSLLSQTTALSKNEENSIHNLWIIPVNLRWRLYKSWVNKFIAEKDRYILRLKATLKKHYEELEEIRRDWDTYTCQTACVVGMTTTGAAKNRDLLQRINPKIVVVEEAAEILESHIVTSLAPETEHVILIGDHQQLRPNPTVYTLAVNYELNISLFERMIKNGIKYSRLNLQHRMRPEIASLLVPHFYEDLKNHESVEKFENIKGLAKNLFFITHSHHEVSNFNSTTKMNLYEARFIARLYRYLRLQGYDSSQITILTTYTGQMYAIRKELERTLANKESYLPLSESDLNESGKREEVRVTVVDNYQGEENEIILMSFVRSNVEKRIGFLKTSNRVCVALSRAKKGLFCIGNFELLVNESSLWENIRGILKEQNAIGPSLQLKCQNHPDICEAVADEKDFDSVPEGGCMRDCGFQMECGHACPLKCHPYDREHETIECNEPCIKLCEREHSCSKKCYENCGNCYIMVDKTVEKCGHETKVFCYCFEKQSVCPNLCQNFFPLIYNGSKVKGLLDNIFFITCSPKTFSMHDFMCEFSKYLRLQGYEDPDVFSYHNLSLNKNVEKKDLVLLEFQEHPDENEFLVHSAQSLFILSNINKGVFCIGDFDLFTEKFEFWEGITDALRLAGKIGPRLTLQCQNHPEMCETISQTKDFFSVGAGGCTKQCNFVYTCGHGCSSKCHPNDMEHKEIKCKEPCERKCKLGHLCSKACCEKCECFESIDKKLESCGHIQKVKCFSQDKPISCLQLCERVLPCGHKCTRKCSEPCDKKCEERITVKLTDCSHECAIKCWMQPVITPFWELCRKPCQVLLSCGHVCDGTCGSCCGGRFHIPCGKRCQRTLICGHKCPSKCFESCPPCKQPCRRGCRHAVCRKSCGQPCEPCTKPCGWKCAHEQCNKKCGEKCDRPPCDESCTKSLRCGHQCIGFCGEPCPRLCRTCDEKELSKVCGGIDVSNALFVRLEHCQHIFEVSYLTELMNLDSGKIHAKRCPICMRDISRNLRFGNILKNHFQNINCVIKITSGDEDTINKTRFNLMEAAYCIKNSVLGKEIIEQGLSTRMNVQKLNIMQNLVHILLNYSSVFSVDKMIHLKEKHGSNEVGSTIDLDLCKRLQSYINEAKDWMIHFTGKNTFHVTNHQLRDLAWEAHRVALAEKLLKILDLAPKLTSDAGAQVNELMNSLLTIVHFDAKDAKRLHLQLEKIMVVFSVKQSDDIKPSVLKSVSLSEGTWYRCEKGHIFSSITCPETSDAKACYECDSSIASLPSPTPTDIPHTERRRSNPVNKYRRRDVLIGVRQPRILGSIGKMMHKFN